VNVTQVIAKDVAGTGAVAGDWVVCVSTNEVRFTVGQKYLVFDHLNRPHISSGTVIAVAGDKTGAKGYTMPWRGFGATWRLVARK
jgi:hypothetical protein